MVDKSAIVSFLRQITARLFEDGVASALMDMTQIGEYGVVYREGWSPVDPEPSVMATGVLHSMDVVGVVLHIISVQGFTGQYIRIPWQRIGYIWSMPLSDAMEMLQAGEKPAFVN